MAISTIGSYLPTMREFIDHWTAANVSIAPAALILKGGYTLAMFTADRAAIESAITGIEAVDNDRQGASADREMMKAGARQRLAQYRGMVTGLLDGTPYFDTLPLLPPFGANQGIFLKPMDEMANGWGRINTDSIPGFTPPLILSGGYDLAAYTADLAALRIAYVASTNAEDNSEQQRSVRNALLGPARARMIQYRSAVRGFIPPGSPLLLTIPAYSPPPGATPAAVNLSGAWNAESLEADLSWTASPNPHLDHYSIRTAPGPTYKAVDESVVGRAPSNQTTFSTNHGLTASGATALFRVYVVLTTANEKGSNTVSVVRPA